MNDDLPASSWGGSRPGNPNGRRGGVRSRTGLQTRIKLSKQTALLLKHYTIKRRAVTGNLDLTADQVAEELIEKGIGSDTHL